MYKALYDTENAKKMSWGPTVRTHSTMVAAHHVVQNFCAILKLQNGAKLNFVQGTYSRPAVDPESFPLRTVQVFIQFIFYEFIWWKLKI